MRNPGETSEPHVESESASEGKLSITKCVFCLQSNFILLE